MAIRVNLDAMMERRRIGLTELSDKSGVSLRNLTILRDNRARAIRTTTLDAICRVLDCQPGDILNSRMHKSRRGGGCGKGPRMPDRQRHNGSVKTGYSL